MVNLDWIPFVHRKLNKLKFIDYHNYSDKQKENKCGGRRDIQIKYNNDDEEEDKAFFSSNQSPTKNSDGTPNQHLLHHPHHHI